MSVCDGMSLIEGMLQYSDVEWHGMESDTRLAVSGNMDRVFLQQLSSATDVLESVQRRVYQNVPYRQAGDCLLELRGLILRHASCVIVSCGQICHNKSYS